MKILLLGANGQVGWECRRSLSTMGELEIHDRVTADFSQLKQLQQVVRQASPDIIVNAAAYTAVDQAEADEEAAFRINAEAVAVLAEEAKKLKACLMHYSTDYVFDGTREGFYLEDDETNPQSVYGKSKRDGEQAIMESGCSYFILRTSWVYALRGNNFAKTMIRLARERDELKVVDDQVGAPTSAELIADITALLLYNIRKHGNFAEKHSGIYHLVAEGEASWFDFAKTVLAKAEELGLPMKIKAQDIKTINTSDFPRPAKRPANSRLNNRKLKMLLNIEIPDWHHHADKMVTEYLETYHATA